MGFGRGALLWLLGIPLPIIILLALFWHHLGTYTPLSSVRNHECLPPTLACCHLPVFGLRGWVLF